MRESNFLRVSFARRVPRCLNKSKTYRCTGHIHTLCQAWKRLWLYEGYLNLASEAVIAAPFVPFCLERNDGYIEKQC